MNKYDTLPYLLMKNMPLPWKRFYIDVHAKKINSFGWTKLFTRQGRIKRCALSKLVYPAAFTDWPHNVWKIVWRKFVKIVILWHTLYFLVMCAGKNSRASPHLPRQRKIQIVCWRSVDIPTPCPAVRERIWKIPLPLHRLLDQYFILSKGGDDVLTVQHRQNSIRQWGGDGTDCHKKLAVL